MNQSQPGHQAPLYHVNAHPSMQMLYHHHPHMQVPVYYQVLNLANDSGLFQGCKFSSFFLVNKVCSPFGHSPLTSDGGLGFHIWNNFLHQVFLKSTLEICTFLRATFFGVFKKNILLLGSAYEEQLILEDPKF